MLASSWPVKETPHATPDEVKQWDIHVKEVEGADLDIRLQQIIELEKDFRAHVPVEQRNSTVFRRTMHMITHIQDLEKMERHKKTRSDPHCMELSKTDITTLQKMGLIEQQAQHERSNLRMFSTVEEKELNGKRARRRAITHTPFTNEYDKCFDRVTIQAPLEQIKSCKQFAICIDFKSFFHQFRLPRRMQRWWFSAEGITYRLKTIPTGSTFSPLIAQTYTDAITAWLKNAFPLVAISSFIDNMRISADCQGYLRLAVAKLLEKLEELNIAVNESKEEVARMDTQKFQYLGVVYNMTNGTVELTQKMRAKMEKVAALTFENMTVRQVLGVFGTLVYASAVTTLPRGRYFYAVKFMRRRAAEQRPLAAAAEVWPSTHGIFRQWARDILQQPAATIRKNTNDRWELFTDASDTGHGLVLLGNLGQTFVSGGVWSDKMFPRHINIKEAAALLMALELVPTLWDTHTLQSRPEIIVRVDNTSVVWSARNMASKSFLLNRYVTRITQHPIWVLVKEIQYVKSEANIADLPSRLAQETQRTHKPWSASARSFLYRRSTLQTWAKAVQGEKCEHETNPGHCDLRLKKSL